MDCSTPTSRVSTRSSSFSSPKSNGIVPVSTVGQSFVLLFFNHQWNLLSICVTPKRIQPLFFFFKEKTTLTQVRTRAIHSNTFERPKGSVRKLFRKATHSSSVLFFAFVGSLNAEPATRQRPHERLMHARATHRHER